MSLVLSLLLGIAQADSGCFGVVDYAGEIVPSAVALASQDDRPGGLSEVAIDVTLTNLGEARFGFAEARVGPTMLAIAPGSVRPATFGGFADGAIASTEPLRLASPRATWPASWRGSATGPCRSWCTPRSSPRCSPGSTC